MIVHTHLQCTNATTFNSAWELVKLWKASWELLGFTTIITSQEYLVSKPETDVYLTKIATLPSVNPAGFDYAAFSRWVAAYVVTNTLKLPIVTTEYDLINYSITPKNILEIDPNYLNICRPEGCPVLAYGEASAFHSMLNDLLEYELKDRDKVNDRPHMSDQDFIWRSFSNHSMFRELDTNKLNIMNVFDPDWNKASAVHYGTPFIVRNKLNPSNKHLLIQQLRSI